MWHCVHENLLQMGGRRQESRAYGVAAFVLICRNCLAVRAAVVVPVSQTAHIVLKTSFLLFKTFDERVDPCKFFRLFSGLKFAFSLWLRQRHLCHLVLNKHGGKLLTLVIFDECCGKVRFEKRGGELGAALHAYGSGDSIGCEKLHVASLARSVSSACTGIQCC